MQKKIFLHGLINGRIMAKMPSDLGFNDERYILPELIINKHVVRKSKSILDINGQIQMFTPIAKYNDRGKIRAKTNRRKKM